MSGHLIKYNAARRALAEAVRVDEVKDIRDQAVAMQTYAKLAKDSELIDHATDIRLRAERRLGEIMEEERSAGKLAKGGGGRHGRKRVSEKPALPLAKQGIDKNLADRARKAAALSEDKFEASVARAKRIAVAATVNDREVIRAARVEAQHKKRQRREARERELAAATEAASKALGEKVYAVIYADPAWRFEPYSRETSNCTADNHYPTEEIEKIKRTRVPAADDAVLFMWATVPMLPQALEVMAAWGFHYKSAIFWEKDRAGTGYWVRNTVEILLIGTRGNVPAPSPGEQPPQVIRAPRGRHSEKPAVIAEEIERLYPNVPKIEMFARKARPGWTAWGNEIARGSEAA